MNNCKLTFESDKLNTKQKEILNRNANLKLMILNSNSCELNVNFNFTNEVFSTIFEEYNDWRYFPITINVNEYHNDHIIKSDCLKNMVYNPASINNKMVEVKFTTKT